VTERTAASGVSPLAESEQWEAVIGLEVHCELSTATKMFCSCPNEFGAEPNTNVCPVCLGLPGSLPVLNEKAVAPALRGGRTSTPERSVLREELRCPETPKDYRSQYEAHRRR
jgi:aspartyl-tRNA(Asn)/glutamyl-tRNA(Gln) amidotransferase subunit B